MHALRCAVGAVAGCSTALVVGTAAAVTNDASTLIYSPGESGLPRLQTIIEAIGPSQTVRTSNTEIREIILSNGATITVGYNSEIVLERAADGTATVRLMSGTARLIGILGETLQVVLPNGRFAMQNSAATIGVTPGTNESVVQLAYGQPLEIIGTRGPVVLAMPGFAVRWDRNGESAQPQRLEGDDATRLLAQLSTRGIGEREPAGNTQLVAAVDRDSSIGTVLLGDEAVAISTEDQPRAAVERPGDSPGETPPPATPGGPGTTPPPTGGTTPPPTGGPGTTPPPTGGPETTPTPPSPGGPVATPPIPPAPPVPLTPVGRPDSVGAGGSFAGLGPGAGADAPLVSNNQPSQANGDRRLTTQTYANISGNAEPTRAAGRITNRLYSSAEPFTQVLGGAVGPTSISDPVLPAPGAQNYALRYVFSSDGLVLQSNNTYDPSTHIRFTPGPTFDVTAPVLLFANPYQSPGNVLTVDQQTVTGNSNLGRGSFFTPATRFELLQSGFTPAVRAADNFLFLQLRPGVITSRANDAITAAFAQSSDPFAFAESIGLGIRGRFGLTPITLSAAHTIGKIVANGLDSAGLTSADRRNPTQGGYNAYVTRVQPILNEIDAAGLGDLATDVREALIGATFNTFTINPTVNIDALRALAQDASGTPTDLIALVTTLGTGLTGSSVDFTRAQLNALATALTPSAPGAEVTEAKLLPFAFLDENDRQVVLNAVNVITANALDASRKERFIFAAGDVDARLDGGFAQTFSVDRFFLSAGLAGFEQRASQTITDGIRGFFRSETALGLDLFDSGVYVVNPATAGGNAVTAFAHADFGMSGTGAAQQSTLSLTLGEVTYTTEVCAACDVTNSIEVRVNGRSIGSSRGNIVTTNSIGTAAPPVFGTLALSSPLRSTAAGGGNPALPRPGYAGYLVLENYDPANLAINPGDTPLNGGVEHVVGDVDDDLDVGYGYLRLATATGTQTIGTRTDATFDGFAAGLGQIETLQGLRITQVDSGETLGGFRVTTQAATNRVSSDLRLFGAASPIGLGGLTGTASRGASAFVDNERFAARSVTEGSELGLVSAGLVRDGLPTAITNDLSDSEYFEWGFFFGDFTASQQTQHVHLGTWVAGTATPAVDMPATGTATYAGQALGEVYDGAALYLASGEFENSWNFATRRGEMEMMFDRTAYAGPTEIQSGTSSFIGTLEAAGRAGGLFGNFVSGGGDPVAAEIGRFSISNTASAAGTYRASGTFGGERAPD
jgi:hypothetical protein